MSTNDSSDDLQDRIGSLYFYALRSQRYHQHRHGFWSTWLRVIQFVNLILGSGAVLTYFADTGELGDLFLPSELLVLSPVVAAVTSLWIISFNVVDLAGLHLRLREAWIDFEQAVLSANSRGPDRSDLEQLNRRRLELQRLEPPVYHAVNRMCRNEVITSLDLAVPLEKMNSWHWLFKNIYRFKRIVVSARRT